MLTGFLFTVTTLDDVTSASDGQTSLREALAQSNTLPSADTIDFQPGLTGTIVLHGAELTISDDVTISGPGANVLAVKANRIFSVIRVDDATAVLSGLTLTGGGGETRGGVAEGAAEGGGGIYCRNSDVTLDQMTIAGNIANLGGGGVAAEVSVLTIRNSTISNNACGAYTGGGGIYFSAPVPHDDSTPALRISNSTISGNRSIGVGGGVLVARSEAEFRNCTITGNRSDSEQEIAGRSGGGIFIEHSDFSTAVTTLQNTIVAGNWRRTTGATPDDVSGQDPVGSASGYNLIGDPSAAVGLVDGVNGNIVGSGGPGPLNVATVLDPVLSNNGGRTLTHVLVGGSRAINAGSTGLLFSSTDQRGLPRTSSSSVDIGAVELQAPQVFLGGTATYVENAPPVVLAKSAFVNDLDNPVFPQGALYVQVTTNPNAADRLWVRHQGNGPGQIGVSGDTISYGGTRIATLSGGAGNGALVVALNSAPLAAVQALVRSITFRSLGENPTTLPRTISFALNDGRGLNSNAATMTVNVTAVNDAPELTLSGSLGYVHNDPAVVLAPNALLTDDSPNFDGGLLNVHVTANNNSSNRLAIGSGFVVDAGNNVKLNGVTIGHRTSDGVGTNWLLVKFNAYATKAIVQQLIRSITFKTVAGSAGQRKIVFTVSDGDGGMSANQTKTVNVT